MPATFAKIAFTPHVQQQQELNGSRRQYQRMERITPHAEGFGQEETEFIHSRDGFYVATVGETGWPYIQFRGGPAGFLRVLDENTLGFADFRGNRQYITLGNLQTNNRVALFLMDYPGEARLKILGRAEIKSATDDPTLAERLIVPSYRAIPERLILIHLAGMDWNCRQHITPRWTQGEIALALEPMQRRLEELEAENMQLKRRSVQTTLEATPGGEIAGTQDQR